VNSVTPRASLSGYRHLASGKVRDIYRVDDDTLLIVASDRISAYDLVLPTPIPDKGTVLTAMSMFWFELLAEVSAAHPAIPHHVVSVDDSRIPESVRGRSMLVRRLRMVPVECVARGYLTGSGLAEYAATGAVCGVRLPGGLTNSSQLPEPIFTPAAKAALGEHDQNISFDAVISMVGGDLAERLRSLTLSVYSRGARHAAGRGVLLADTKLEFGIDPEGTVVLADEVLTPDSSRYWSAEGYAAGRPQPSFDKQYLRDWLISPSSGWDRTTGEPPPALPSDVVAATRRRYIQAYQLVSGREFADWLR
jgi:phosphoribosylaminoimidazole-succinocarboxamide synthase